MIIREALEADAHQIAALQAANWRSIYRGLITEAFLDGDLGIERSAFWVDRLGTLQANQRVFIAEEQGTVIGFACLCTNVDEHWGSLLDNLHVSQSMQRQGVGTELMAAVAKWCIASHVSGGLFLWVVQSNLQAQRFYEALGGVKAGSGIWVPPGGGSVKKDRYAWTNVLLLLEKAAHRLCKPAL